MLDNRVVTALFVYLEKIYNTKETNIFYLYSCCLQI